MVSFTGVSQCCQSAEGKEERTGRSQPFAPCESGKKNQSPASVLLVKGIQRPVVVIEWNYNGRAAKECVCSQSVADTVQIWSLAFRAFFPG